MKPFKISYFSSTDGELYNAIMAKEELNKSHRGFFEIDIHSKYTLKRNFQPFFESALNSDFVLITLMGGLRTFGNRSDFLEDVKKEGIPLHVQTSVMDTQGNLKPFCNTSEKDYNTIESYIKYSGKENYINLFKYIGRSYGNLNLNYNEPEEIPWDGIYHPKYGIFSDLETYKDKRKFSSKETIGILFYRSNYIGNNIKHIDALIKAIEDKGHNALPIFVYSPAKNGEGNLGLEGVIDKFFIHKGGVVINTLVNAMGFSLTSGTRSIKKSKNYHLLKKLDIPIIKAMVTTQNYEDWWRSEKGISIMDYSLNLALPEYDGQVTTFPISTKEKLNEGIFNLEELYFHRPIIERTKRAVDLAINYGKLNTKKNKDKRVAIIFHNYPPGDGNIGSASGLDSLESVARLLNTMEKREYHIENRPDSSKELIEGLLEWSTNEREWISEKKLDLSSILLKKELYKEMFKKFPEKNQIEMEKQWGKAPGNVLVYEENIVVPGRIYGNIFIGLQPARGWGDDPSQIYHNPDMPPTHQYMAFYHWIKNIFKADAIIHVGTHGNLEWLPGKSVGLSNICYTDLAISTLPHFYYYIIKNPGEGTQAKRRSYAAIVDYMIPSIKAVEGYDELQEIETKINMYYESKLTDEGKLELHKKQIWEKVLYLNLHKDLDYTEKTALKDFELFLENLHGYINEVKHTQIKEGLHILGQPLGGEKLINMILSILRLPNGDIPSLIEAISKIKGYDYEYLLNYRGRFDEVNGKTNGCILDDIHKLAKEIITDLYKDDFKQDVIEEILEKYDITSCEELRGILDFICSNLVKRIKGVEDEITNMLEGLNGRFIPPGPCGNITRGGANLLPTGRNFYTLDPSTVPTTVAWEVGKKLGNELLKIYYEEEGRYPESIGIVIWGTPTLRTKGDDIAQILYLLGLRPVWNKANGYVKDLEVIPLNELGRPRIDITVRISGLFRDTFPAVIKLLDRAFEIVGNLDEAEDLNFIAKNIKKEILERIKEGESLKEATENSTHRIFGCKPGTYGTGVNHAVDTKNWTDDSDLANIYLNWGAYVYSRNKEGQFNRDIFKKRLSMIELTTQNTSSRETDILDADDFYHYHGGLANAVKVVKGAAPKMYCGDSSDPERIKIRTADKELKYIYRSRVLNPKWIEAMKVHGYKGAAEFSKTIDYSFGWDATANIMEDWMYEEISQKYVLDKDMKKWFEKNNLHAYSNIIERLLEADQRGMWQPKTETIEDLKIKYIQNEGLLESKL